MFSMEAWTKPSLKCPSLIAENFQTRKKKKKKRHYLSVNALLMKGDVHSGGAPEHYKAMAIYEVLRGRNVNAHVEPATGWSLPFNRSR